MCNEAKRVITMYVAPHTSERIMPSDIVQGDGESDKAYAARQELLIELWSIPDNA